MIRPITEEDLPQVAALFSEVFSLPPWCEDWSYEKAHDYVEKGFRTGGFLGFVVIIDESLVATLLGGCQGTEPSSLFKIAEIFVGLDYQRQGIGAALFKHLSQHLRKLSVQRITASTLIGSPAAQFYLNQGFIDTGPTSYNTRKHIFEKTMSVANCEE